MIISSLLYGISSAATPSASQIERTQEILEKGEALMNKIEKKEKKFIKKIIVQGVLSFSQDQIKEIILPFQKKWLTEVDIQQILDSFKELYKRQGKPLARISYQIKGNQLFIKAEE